LSGAERRLVLPTREEKPCRLSDREAIPRSRVPLRRRRIRTDWYERCQVSHEEQKLVARVLVDPGRGSTMSVREDQDVMDLDFRQTVTRPGPRRRSLSETPRPLSGRRSPDPP
jgi:hypothetical protein